MKNRIIATVAMAFGLALAAVPASAGFVSGSITMSGDFAPTGGTGLGDATGIDFLGDDFDIDGATLDFAAAGISQGDIGVINDFTFDPFTVAPFALWEIAGFTFNLLSIQVPFHTDFYLVLSGQGMVSGNGFDSTIGYWNLTANRAGTLFNFSSGTVVPEPSSLLLFGLGFAGLAVARRRRS